MKRIGVLLFLLSLQVAPVLAKTSVWKVSDGKNHMFLAGTIHVLSASDYPLPKQYASVYQQSGVLAFEVDLAQTEGQAFQQKVMQQGMFGPGTNVESVLNPKTLKRLKQYMGQNGINYQAWAQFKPGLLSIMLTMQQLAKNGVSEQGVDKFWYVKAKADGKPIEALETVDAQLRFMLNMGKGLEDAMIIQTLDDISRLSSIMPQMVKAWREGDMKTLSTLALDTWKDDYPALYDDLLARRNLNWIPQLKAMMETPAKEMVLVGVLHMPGQEGLLSLLAKQGYSITQL